MTTVKQSKTLFLYAHLQDAAHENLELLQKKGRFRRNARLEAMLLAALTIEAWLNHIGPYLLKCWDDIERSLSPKQKLLLILEKISYLPNLGERPYQTISDMFRLRNLLVHGSTHQVADVISEQDWLPGEFPQDPILPIEAMLTDLNAERFICDMDAIIIDLWKHSGITDKSATPGIMGSCEYTTDVTRKLRSLR